MIPHQWEIGGLDLGLDINDSEAESAGPIDLDLSEIAAQCAASDLLDFAAQLAGLAEDLKALAATPIEPIPTAADPDDQLEASSSSRSTGAARHAS
ncbi:hypothetical protein [Sinorhizobium meliloti]|uniref:hypothetical protein n=1 Tax=Rhizobium meliloti TaxID=382 RepID=UPI001F47EDC2|nr:hypothetical protein [Sinorhizobium meliloti]